MSTSSPQQHRIGPGTPSGALPESPLTFGIALPTFPQHGPVDFPLVIETARLAERLGYTDAWLWDHLAWHAPCAESLTTAAAVLASTDRLGVGLGILQIPLRDPHLLSAQVATLTDLGGERFTLGIGYGQRVDEFIALEVDFESRWRAGNRILDETLARFAQLRPGRPLRVIKGGRSVAAVRSSAKTDGWMGAFVSPEGLAARLAHVDPRPRWVSTQVFVCPPGRRGDSLHWMSSLYQLPSERFSHQLLPDHPDELRAVVAQYAKAGVHHLSFAIAADDPTETIEYLAAELWGRADGGPSNAV